MAILDHAEWVVFVLIFANQAGVPVFATPVLLGIGALVWNGDVNVGVVVSVAVGAALCADLAWYGLGRWRGTWALSALRGLSSRAGGFVDDTQRLFLAHDRAFQLAARFLPELNPVAAAFAGVARVNLKRFVVGATASAAVWAGTWIGTGYLIGGAIWSGGGWGIPFFAVIVAALAAALGVLIRPSRRAIAAISRSLRDDAAPRPDDKPCTPTSWSETGGRHGDATLRPRRDRAVCCRVRVARVDEAAGASPS